MNSANEDDKQWARSRSYLQLRSVRGCLSKHHSDGSHFLMELGREFLTDDPENARLVLYRSVRGRGGIKLFEPYLPVDLVKSQRMYSGVSPLHT